MPPNNCLNVADNYPGGFDAHAGGLPASVNCPTCNEDGNPNSGFIIPSPGRPSAPIPTQLQFLQLGAYSAYNDTYMFRPDYSNIAQLVNVAADGKSYQDFHGTCGGNYHRGVCGGMISTSVIGIGSMDGGQTNFYAFGGGNWFDSNMHTSGDDNGCCHGTFKGPDGLCYISADEFPTLSECPAGNPKWLKPEHVQGGLATPCGHCGSVNQHSNYNQFADAATGEYSSGLNLSNYTHNASDEFMYGDCSPFCQTLEEIQVEQFGACSCVSPALPPEGGGLVINPQPQILFYDDCGDCNGTNACIKEGKFRSLY